MVMSKKNRSKSPVNTSEPQQINARRLKIILLSLLFLVPCWIILFTTLEVELYRNTVIDWVIPTSIYIVGGLVFSPMTSKLVGGYSTLSDYFWFSVGNILVFGGIVAYIFMALNFYFPSGEPTFLKVQIIKRGYLSSGKSRYRGEPYADVKIYGADKELIFPRDIEIKNFKYVGVSIKKGLWGFDIIESKTLLTE